MYGRNAASSFFIRDTETRGALSLYMKFLFKKQAAPVRAACCSIIFIEILSLSQILST